MEILGKILGTPARVKIMRLFLLNRSKAFVKKDIMNRCRISAHLASKEIRLLASVGFLKKRGLVWNFNPSFKYSAEFENLLVTVDTFDKQSIANDFKKFGRVKLLAMSGVFIKNKDSRVDLLIVGDNMKKKKIEEEVKRLEAEIGMELVYATFSTKEFIYRVSMYDKLIRDILDFPHEVILQA